MLDRGSERLGDAVWSSARLALTFQIDVEDAVRKVDATVPDKSAPDCDQACVLFRCIRALEVFIHHCPYGVDG